jgi:hypothetical protein
MELMDLLMKNGNAFGNASEVNQTQNSMGVTSQVRIIACIVDALNNISEK